jgi:phosphohistidine phosphatase
MRTLYLIRHAKSSWDSPGLRDFNRPLNERGLRDAPRMALLLAGRGVRPDLLVSSTAKRALTTAQFFAVSLGYPDGAIRREDSIYESAPHNILRIISQLPDEAQTVLLFGHNPTFTEVANMFSDTLIENVPTCGIVQIESSADRWNTVHEGNAKVVNCLFPKELFS